MSDLSTGKRKRDEKDYDDDKRKEKKKDKHKHKKDKEGRSKLKYKKDKRHDEPAADDDEDDWVEKVVEAPSVPAPAARPAEPKLERDAWMTHGEPPAEAGQSGGGGSDFFSSMGMERKKPAKDVLDPEKPQISRRELNPTLNPSSTLHTPSTPGPSSSAITNEEKPKSTPGGAGSQWRMMKLRRVYETAEEEGRPVEEVAIERFQSLEAFEEAVEEKKILDARDGRLETPRGRQMDRPGEKGFMFNDGPGSMASSRSSSFRRPGGASTPSMPSTPSAVNRRVEGVRQGTGFNSPLARVHTPIPTVMTPPPPNARGSTAGKLTQDELNKLQAKALRAKLMNAPDAASLQAEYDAAAAKGVASNASKVEVLPTLDAHGRLYDVGHGKQDDDDKRPGNRKKKDEKFQSHDPKTGEVLNYNADDDKTSLQELIRQEKFGAGMQDQKDLDAEFARAVMGDGKFQNDLDYIDDNAEKLARKKMRSDAMKRGFAVQDYKRTQTALATCPFCYQTNAAGDEAPPKAPVIAMGTRSYLSCTLKEELVKGHCIIVPMEHHLCMLEADDEVWEEVKNFMKTLLQWHASLDQTVVFYETVLSHKWQKHTFIECVPVQWEIFDLLPGYFKESILSSEAEWSQHRKLIDFSKRPGGFRRSLVPNLPYFMVQFDYKGEKGYGHVIEGTGGEQDDEEEDGKRGGDADKGKEFPSYFAAEIIGNVLEIEPRKWRRPHKVDFTMNKERVKVFRQGYDQYDWTKMIGKE